MLLQFKIKIQTKLQHVNILIKETHRLNNEGPLTPSHKNRHTVWHFRLDSTSDSHTTHTLHTHGSDRHVWAAETCVTDCEGAGKQSCLSTVWVFWTGRAQRDQRTTECGDTTGGRLCRVTLFDSVSPFKRVTQLSMAGGGFPNAEYHI